MHSITIFSNVFYIILFFFAFLFGLPFVILHKNWIKNLYTRAVITKTQKLLLVLLFAGTLTFMLGQVIFIDWRGTDFCQEYFAIHQLITKQPIYIPLHCWLGYSPNPQHYNSHPPFSVLFFLPFVFFTRIQATIIWGFISLGCYILSGILLLRELTWLSFRNITFFLFFSVWWVPFLRAEEVLNYGQLFLLFFILAWILARKQQYGKAGILLGVTSLLKIWPIVFLALSFIQGKKKIAYSGVLTVIAGSLLTFFIAGKQIYIDYFTKAQPNEYHWIVHIGNYSLVGLIARFFLRYLFSFYQSVLLAQCVGLLCMLGVFCFLWYCLRKQKTHQTFLLSNSILLTTILFTFPVIWEWEYIFLLFLMTTTYVFVRLQRGIPGWWKYITVMSLVIFLEPNIILDSFKHVQKLTLFHFLLIALPTYAIIVFTAMQMYLLWWYTNKAKE